MHVWTVLDLDCLEGLMGVRLALLGIACYVMLYIGIMEYYGNQLLRCMDRFLEMVLMS